jgi:hypothetical protein
MVLEKLKTFEFIFFQKLFDKLPFQKVAFLNALFAFSNYLNIN